MSFRATHPRLSPDPSLPVCLGVTCTLHMRKLAWDKGKDAPSLTMLESSSTGPRDETSSPMVKFLDVKMPCLRAWICQSASDPRQRKWSPGAGTARLIHVKGKVAGRRLRKPWLAPELAELWHRDN